MKTFGIFFLILFFSLNLFAQNFSHQKVLQSIEQRDYQTAISELKSLRQSDKNLFELNNYDYLLGRLSEKSSNFADAMANYQTVVNRNSVLKEYALWHLAEIARSSGNLFLERTLLQELPVFAPESLLTNTVNQRLPRSFFESKNYESAIQLLSVQPTMINRQAQDKSTNNRFTRENTVYLAQSYLQSNQIEKARELFTQLTNNLPNPAQPDDYALAGAKGLDLLDVGNEKFGKEAPSLPDFEHLRRALIYNFNRDFPNARLHYKAIIEKHPSSGNVPDAIYQIGRGYSQIGEFVEANKWFERVQEQFPDHPISKDALSQSASIYARVNKPKEAVTRYQKFIEKFPNDERLERAYLNIVDVFRDTGENSDALKWTLKTQEVFKGKLPEALALFAQARIHITQNDWQNALLDLDKLLSLQDLGGTRVPAGTNKAEVTFMKGFALESLQRYAEAIEIYLSIQDGRSEYFGWRATERLRILANDEKAKSFIAQKNFELLKNLEAQPPEIQKRNIHAVLRLNESPELRAKLLETLKKVYSALPEYQKIPTFKLIELGRKETIKEKKTITVSHKTISDELLFLGLYDEATPELEKSLTTLNTDLNYTLATFYKRGQMAHRAVGFAEPLWKNVPADYQIELIPRDQAELLYPAPYADSLLRYAPERNVDTRYALSIMRQESRYRADVKSYAAARGLMQFISTTADRIAKELDKDNFNQDELYNPPTAILFGSQYLSDLFKMFPNQPQAVAGSYNGGEDNLKRWIARSKSENADRYVPEIVFSQSKDYVYKVMANYRVYQIFYDENLKSR